MTYRIRPLAVAIGIAFSVPGWAQTMDEIVVSA